MIDWKLKQSNQWVQIEINQAHPDKASNFHQLFSFTIQYTAVSYIIEIFETIKLVTVKEEGLETCLVAGKIGLWGSKHESIKPNLFTTFTSQPKLFVK